MFRRRILEPQHYLAMAAGDRKQRKEERWNEWRQGTWKQYLKKKEAARQREEAEKIKARELQKRKEEDERIKAQRELRNRQEAQLADGIIGTRSPENAVGEAWKCSD
ncbi:hypothetical protein AK812_SmicGene327 [Symbiodinium microadriaticum]|uniref:Uncharacterized protein n=1 Tax=Symbiodinium microadriaticum TaxID=2951 RepID=A0A1Q9F6U0_SYMMI|nr:hypothetical protein AK812_SmicGene327 [Symbiodinium microadriaticum]